MHYLPSHSRAGCFFDVIGAKRFSEADKICGYIMKIHELFN